MLFNSIAVVQILLALCYGGLAEKIMRPKFKGVKFWSDEKMVSHKITYDNSDPHLNFSMEVRQELHDLDVHLEARITNKMDPYYTSTVNTTMNICRVLNFANKSPVGRFVQGFMREYGNIIESCPIAKRKYKFHHLRFDRKLQGTYYINKFWWPEDPTTVMLPELEFEIDFQAHHLDAAKKRTLIISDHYGGDFLVQDVNNMKPGIFALLPRTS